MPTFTELWLVGFAVVITILCITSAVEATKTGVKIIYGTVAAVAVSGAGLLLWDVWERRVKGVRVPNQSVPA
jgi:hypothetical protein